MYLRDKAVQILLLGVGAMLLSGCGAKGAKFAGFEAPKENKAMIYIYRPSGFMGHGVYYTVNAGVDNRSTGIGDLRNGGFLKTEVEANKEVEIWAKTEAKSSVTIETKSNQTYCVKGGVGIGFIMGRPQLSIVDMQTCQKEIVDTQEEE